MAAARLYALRRPREHAATAGWAAGCLVQIPEILPSYWTGKSRLADRPGPFGHSLAFYAHDVVLPTLGWHLALALEWLAGRDGATVIVAIPLAVVVGAMLATQPPNRLFVVNALLAGFFFSMFGTTLTPHLATQTVSAENEPGSRYTTLPIFLIECIAVVGVDCVLRQRTAGVRHRRGAWRSRPPGWSTRWSSSSRRAGWPTSGTPASAATRPGTGGRSRPSGSTRASVSRSGVIVERAGPDSYSLPCYHIARYRGRRPQPGKRAEKGERSQVTDMRTGARR